MRSKKRGPKRNVRSEAYIRKLERRRELHKLAAVKEEHRARVLMSRFGLTVDAYDAMVNVQGGVCAICREQCASGMRLSVDHDHMTGEVRGLLCKICNVAIGHLKDDPELLRRAAEYLERRRRAS